MRKIPKEDLFIAYRNEVHITDDHEDTRVILEMRRKNGEVLEYEFRRSTCDLTMTNFKDEHVRLIVHELADDLQCLVLMRAEPVSLFTELYPRMKRLRLHLETMTEDDDLLSTYGRAKWKRCLRSEVDCIFFAGPCTGGSPWNRLSMAKSEVTAHTIN